MAIQKTGATTASEKFSARLSIAARATPAASRVCGVAPDDVRDCLAAGGDAVRCQRSRHIGDMAVQAALRDQRAGEKRRGQNTKRQAQQCGLHQERGAPTMASRITTAATPAARRVDARRAVAIERAVQPCDQPPDPGHRMADGAIQSCRIAEAQLDQHGDESKRDSHGRKRGWGPKAVGRRPRSGSRRRP